MQRHERRDVSDGEVRIKQGGTQLDLDFSESAGSTSGAYEFELEREQQGLIRHVLPFESMKRSEG